jgi:predicted amidohydrolase
MTANANLKRQVRARAAKTGESYTSALRHFRPNPLGDVMPETKHLKLAVAQSTVCDDPRRSDELRYSGARMRDLMRQARDAGARIVHFPEGATCSPSKWVMSIDGPDQVGVADWTRFEWDVLQQEHQQIAELARELQLWTVFGSVHRLTAPHRPHNSLYVISDQGRVVTRYDERFLSNTKVSFMYAPGSEPVTFEVDGFRFGLALGMECHFPEAFSEYERLDVDGVLFSSVGISTLDRSIFATESQGHAATNSYWVSYSVSAQDSPFSPSGVIAPGGNWLAKCPDDGMPSLVTIDLGESSEVIDMAVGAARPWRRRARSDIYRPHFVQSDPRSSDRCVL